MAAKKRRSRGLRGLGASAEQHDRSAKFYTDEAHGFFKDVRELAQKKDCVRAFPNLVGGVSMAAKADAHGSYGVSTGSISLAELKEDKYQAEKAFRKACIPAFKKAGIDGLSGTPRRRRRR